MGIGNGREVVEDPRALSWVNRAASEESVGVAVARRVFRVSEPDCLRHRWGHSSFFAAAGFLLFAVPSALL